MAFNYLQRRLLALAVITLMSILAAELVLSVRQESQTWDEGCHIFAGYSYWERADFGMNPEHPPLVKLLATAPLLTLPLRYPDVQDRYFKVEAFLSGRQFIFSNNADQILVRTRMAAALLTLTLALLVFVAAYEMFGAAAALISLALFVFEPNLLAHGALVTTDVGLTCFLFAVVYAFYRYVKSPSLLRLVLVGISVGFVLAAKHSGLIVFPVLVLLALAELAYRRWGSRHAQDEREAGTTLRGALNLTLSLVAVGLIAVAVLWSFYGFRYSARPHGQELNPSLNVYVTWLQRPIETKAIALFARRHVLPESYLYGLADVRNISDTSPSYLFGKVHPRGQWFYFPAAMVIKSTLGMLVLLLLVPIAIALRRLRCWREILFLSLPPTMHFAQAVTSGLNIGLRHILPIYPFLIVLVAAAAVSLVRQSRKWAYAIALLLLLHAFSSGRAFPDYMAYSNELWGGPDHTYEFLTDSNTDWGQQLPAVKQYLDQRDIKDCWFAYFVETVVDRDYYGVPCKGLPTISSLWLQGQGEVPPSIDGPVLISASVLSGYEFGPGELNPYAQFQKLRPAAIIGRGVFVFEGHFDVPLAAALSHASAASRFADKHQLNDALREAEAAVSLAPNCVRAQNVLGDILLSKNQVELARQAFRQGLLAAQTIEPDYQKHWVPTLQAKLASH